MKKKNIDDNLQPSIYYIAGDWRLLLEHNNLDDNQLRVLMPKEQPIFRNN
jgi:hypothetical protein